MAGDHDGDSGFAYDVETEGQSGGTQYEVEEIVIDVDVEHDEPPQQHGKAPAKPP